MHIPKQIPIEFTGNRRSYSYDDMIEERKDTSETKNLGRADSRNYKIYP